MGCAGSQPGPYTVKNWLLPGFGSSCVATVATLPKIHGTWFSETSWKVARGLREGPEPIGSHRRLSIGRWEARAVPNACSQREETETAQPKCFHANELEAEGGDSVRHCRCVLDCKSYNRLESVSWPGRPPNRLHVMAWNTRCTRANSRSSAWQKMLYVVWPMRRLRTWAEFVRSRQ